MLLKKSSVNSKGPPMWLRVSIVVIAFMAVAVVVFLGNQTYRETEKLAVEQFNQQQLILARSAAMGIESFYKDLSASLSSLARLPSIQKMSPECLQYMQHTLWSLPSRTSIRLLDSNGVLCFIYPFDGWRGELIGRDYSKEPFFKEAKRTGNLSVSGLITNEQGETRIRIAIPVYLAYKTATVRTGNKTGIIVTPIDSSRPGRGRFQGVLIGSFDTERIAESFIFPVVLGKTGYAWVLGEDSIFITHYEEGFTHRNAFLVRIEKNPEISHEVIEQIQRKMIAGEEGVGRYISGWHRGEKGRVEKLIAYTPVHLNNHIWSVAVCAPVNEVKEIAHITKRSERYTLTFVTLTLIIGGIFFFAVSYRWSHSLELEVTNKTRELRETSDYLNKLIRYANAPIIVWDTDKRITIFNKAFERMSGWTEEEVMGQSLDILFPEESRADSRKKIERTLKGKHWESLEVPILRKDGEIHIGLWNSANIYTEDGKTLLATIAQGQDITKRRQTEEKYTEQLKNLIELGKEMRMELRLEILLQNICDMIVKTQGWRQVILSLRDYNTKTSQPVAMAGYDKKTGKEILSKPPTPIKGTEKFQQEKFKISRSYYIDHTHWEKMQAYPADLVIKHVDDLKPDGWDEKDILLIPIQGKDNILGFISPDNPIDGARPTSERIQALEIFADQAAVAIENARLYGQARQEIAERKLVEEALQHKLIALSQPVGEIEGIKLTDIIDIDILQKLQDGFAESYDVASLIFDDKGEPLTKPSNFSDFCKIMRGTKKGMQRCEISDAHLSGLVANKSSAIATCRNFKEILDGAVPILIGNKRVATWGIGQKLTSELPLKKIRKYAGEIGADPEQLIAAGKELKIGSKEQFKRAISFLEAVANDISLLGLQNIQQAREITERKKAEEELATEKERLSVTLRAIGDGVIATDTEGKIIMFNKVPYSQGW
jgi:PAS domain S-box-containing protein